MPIHQHFDYALRDGEAVHIDDVPSGLACGCVCPACGEPLVARKGKVREHHFAHKGGGQCAHAYESALHLAAKAILAKVRSMWVPEGMLFFEGSAKRPIMVSKARRVAIDRVEFEAREDCVVPDVVVWSGDERIFVEILVTHAVDERKAEKLARIGVSTLEIDLGGMRCGVGDKELEAALVGKDPRKSWVYHRGAADMLDKFLSVAERLECVDGSPLVRGCPLWSFWLDGDSFADLYGDCMRCVYCVGSKPGGYALCTGARRIAYPSDFDMDSADLLAQRRMDEFVRMKAKVDEGMCPRCGRKLDFRSGDVGTVASCPGGKRCGFSFAMDWSTGEAIAYPDEDTKVRLLARADREHCPWCGSGMELMKDHWGTFRGCSRYPDCTFVEGPVEDAAG